jgi:signal peptidase I
MSMRILDRRLSRIPQRWRRIVDWLVTIAVAAAFVLAFQAEVAKPYRIPSSSMEPTLHCAKPGDFCEGRFDDRVIANRLAYRFGDPERGQIVVFTAPEAADRCGGQDGGSTFVKRIVGLPGERVSERDGVFYIDGKRLVEALRRFVAEGPREQALATHRTRPLLPPGR